MGRPTKYRPEFVQLAKNYCELGATDAQLAKYFEVDEKTINTWKLKHPEFLQSLKGAKLLADEKVERSLFERACGYSVPEEKIFCTNGEVTVVATTKHYPPDTTACIFWLKNRKPDDWRDQRNINIEVLTDEERMERIDILLQSVLDREAGELTH
jgi:hypothetical protein